MYIYTYFLAVLNKLNGQPLSSSQKLVTLASAKQHLRKPSAT